MYDISLYVDGACSNNGLINSIGAWGAVLIYKNHIKQAGNIIDDKLTCTNQRAEIIAIIEGLKLLTKSCNITIYTDSLYVINTITQNWKRNANQDLWLILDNQLKKHVYNFKWIKGHSGNNYNEMANIIAQQCTKTKIRWSN